jgi:hypothetical protein
LHGLGILSLCINSEKIEFKGKTLQELTDLYDSLDEEGKQWMIDNLHLWFE